MNFNLFLKKVGLWEVGSEKWEMCYETHFKY